MRTFIIVILFLSCIFSFSSFAESFISDRSVYQKKTDLPVLKEVDVIVVGGSVSAVSAAVSAAIKGASVTLVTPNPYLGEDICAVLNLSNTQKEVYETDLERIIFSEEKILSPLQVKSKLITYLSHNSVDIIFSSFPTDVLVTDKKEIIGLAIGNRAGRQIILAKAIIDATKRATVCRIAGTPAYEWAGGKYPFSRNIINKITGDTIVEKQNMMFSLSDFGFQNLSSIEQRARDLTYSPDLTRGAEALDYLSPDPVHCKKSFNEYAGFHIGHYQSVLSDYLFVLSSSADVPREVAASLQNEAGKKMRLGENIGEYAAEIVKDKIISGKYKGQTLQGIAPPENHSLTISEVTSVLRRADMPKMTLPIEEKRIPVFAEYDVVVVGGGTSGAPAAIAASRQGCRVLVLDYLEGLGGTGTLGMIGKPYHGKKIGFSASVPFPDSQGSIETKMEWYRKELRKTDADIWFGVVSCGAVVKDNSLQGVVVFTPDGRGAVLAKVVIDATGNADIAISAGASYMYGDIENGNLAIQGSGLPSRELLGTYYNTDYLLVDETDMVNVSSTLQSVQEIKAAEKAFDAGTLIQNRERRRIIGDEMLRYEEQIAGRRYSDVIVHSSSDYDSHGYPSSLFFALLTHDSLSIKENHPAPGGNCYTPYRALLPKGLDNILVTGTAISMDRDVTALMRMQYDIANQGYAAGYAAAMAVQNQVSVRNISIKDLQDHLVTLGNLTKEDIPQKDNFPYNKKTIIKAIEDYGKSVNPETSGVPLAILFTHADEAIPMVIERYNNSPDNEKLKYAKLLGIFGRREGVDLLKKELARYKKWDEKIFQGYMACYAHLPTEMDALILSLAYSGDKSVLPVLLEKVEQLNENVTLSHHLSLAKALERIGDKKSCVYLTNVLLKKGMTGYVISSPEDLKKTVTNDGKKQLWRTLALREIILASTLYKCGDYNDIGKNILLEYRNDVRGLLARYADYVLTNYAPLHKNPLD